ncbi:MAG: hypothetical protein KGL11_11675 [Alphaproteobacteria bacterium]|nr:hypothetical protein [Alphaproteobacteria bacterium]
MITTTKPHGCRSSSAFRRTAVWQNKRAKKCGRASAAVRWIAAGNGRVIAHGSPFAAWALQPQASRGLPATHKQNAAARLGRSRIHDRFVEPIVAPENLGADREGRRAKNSELARGIGFGLQTLGNLGTCGTRDDRRRRLAKPGEHAFDAGR